MAKKTKPSANEKKDFAAAQDQWEREYAETVSGLSQTWYRPGGDKPETIARYFVGFVRQGVDGGAATNRSSLEGKK